MVSEPGAPRDSLGLPWAPWALLDERASGQEPPGDPEIMKMLDLGGALAPRGLQTWKTKTKNRSENKFEHETNNGSGTRKRKPKHVNKNGNEIEIESTQERVIEQGRALALPCV